ncbi:fasciclin domain-containing protein [Brevundimonas lenta]|uniref:Putative surface protein with fasciclin (FAS1) repeats n=1 Tax=Brevundimonas lenta TaxID=424796 RepID=A0A7W6JBM9_9CAUL|nr:fasciclin domain-containing protein [Brevundimonas lenta]MBB4081211.1 putative surface protein with fasciclin (FAS1) repeats [Brevundimonas lenta]
MRSIMRRALAPVAALTLVACSGGDDGKTAGAEAARPSSENLAVALKGEGDLDTLESVTTNSGLASVLEGVGPYTVFAPTNAAFTAGGDLTGEAAKAEAAALLRAHIVPGALTRQDIRAAIDRAGAGGAKMRTMADGMLTFTRDGETIVVTGPDGATARLTGDEELASNGVLQPLDGVLLKPAAPAT